MTVFSQHGVLPQQMDFKYLPLTQEDQDRFIVFRQDREDFKEHRAATQEYLNQTLQWANTKTTNNTDRINATRCLSESFIRFLPYISTETHYHRVGMIHQPIFNRISTTDDEKSTRL